MSKFDLVVELSEKMDEAMISALAECYEMCRKEKFSLIETLEKDIEHYKHTGVLVFTGSAGTEPSQPVPEPPRGRSKQKANTTIRHRSSSKENHASNANEVSGSNSQLENHNSNVTVKLERLSKDFIVNQPAIQNIRMEDLKIKQELIAMPPPQRPPLKQTQRRKNTRNTTKASLAASVEVKVERPSTSSSAEVQILSKKLSIVDLTEEEGDDEEKVVKTGPKTRTKRKHNGNDVSEDSENGATETRVTRTKTRNVAKNQNAEPEHEATEQPAPKSAKMSSKRTKTRKITKNKQNGESSMSAYEDAMSDVEKNKNDNTAVVQDSELDSIARQNETVVIEKPTLPVNETIIISKGVTTAAADLLTEDEDDNVHSVNMTQPKLKTMKQIFSPYASSPVKTRVEAFERLGAEAKSNQTLRMVTRLKTKANEEHTSNTSVAPHVNSNLSKLGAMPKLRSTSKTASSERPQRKEAEAQAKKEAMLQALAEERRQKRQERQLKAQQTRAAIEQEKQKVLASIERAKQEKSKHIVAEKEKKLLKQKEVASKWAATVKKANEKKNEETTCTPQEYPQKPLYLMYEAPLLPTNDCYDSDDSNSAKSYAQCEWEKRKPLLTTLMCMHHVKQLMPFHTAPTTVDLREIFPSIEEKRLKRTSSAIWNTSSEMTSLDVIGEEE